MVYLAKLTQTHTAELTHTHTHTLEWKSHTVWKKIETFCQTYTFGFFH